MYNLMRVFHVPWFSLFSILSSSKRKPIFFPKTILKIYTNPHNPETDFKKYTTAGNKS